MQPLPHQQHIIDLERNRLALFLGTGAGKTFTSLWCMDRLSRSRILIIVPKIVHGKWIKDIDTLFNVTRTDIMVEGRWAILRTNQGMVIDVITKEIFRDKWDMTHDYVYGYDGIIIDEAHYFSGMTSQMTKKMFKYISKFPSDTLSVYLLTATPYLSTPWNIYALARILGHEWNYISFQKEMFIPIAMGGRTIYKPKHNAPDLLQPYKDAIGITIRTEDVIADMPEQSVLELKVDLTEEQKRAIKNDTTVDILPRITKLHQIENGYIPESVLEMRKAVDLPNNKISEVLHYAQKHKNVAFICRYTRQVEMAEKALTDAGIKTLSLTGMTKDRDKVIEKARTGKCAIVIQAGVSEGYELPEIEHVMFVSMDWSYKNYVQMMGRFLRINMPTPTEFIILLSGHIDRRILQAIRNKEDFYAKI